ncbi:hypothetical protein L2E82_32486 [Cichorium intybus]|uniref:Uncharacterized protein n=1 Tax=Cichorium intybus TaxID=13427 RepID=A0ACB9BGK1_CICIN|nr:hypothetical protein L2E82_32486 [Cichorium intybus]
MMPRKTKGRQKIEMTRMAKESNLLVTFSKRRSGLFKKASELSILCGVELTIIVFSPGKKVFSFGHPSVEMIVDRYLSQNPPPNSSTSQLVEAHRNAKIHELNRQLTCVTSQFELEKNKSEHLTNIRKVGQDNHWWEAPTESLRLEELYKLKEAMEMLKKNIEEQTKRHMVEAANSMRIVPIPGSVGIAGDSIEQKSYGLGLSMTSHGEWPFQSLNQASTSRHLEFDGSNSRRF